ncbi:MAG: ferredoxin [Patescibacteria group bacterium]|nr:ferredoxin [Patescibacteria group bacterium]
MSFKIEIDKEKCIGCGSCAAICPENFEIASDGKAQVKKSDIKELGCSKQAEEMCPVQAIKIKHI